MEAERWQRIVDLAEAAAELPGDERAAFLGEACAGDSALRTEVESLLESDGQSEGFIETSGFRIAAELIADDPAGSLVGQDLGGYKIVDLLGVGGMGEVYLAEDTRLGRNVALKFLPDYFTDDKARVRRFEQEARAASALNHPNILTVYEIGESLGTQFIATEFVEGTTLRQHMAGVQMTNGEVLDIAIQVASALHVAHQAGIVHRDIKPENIMLRSDGYIKVVDFGLAKISEQHRAIVDSDGLLEFQSDTQAGLVLGTPHYMSPEQARGLKLDGRSDIFSLGAVIYEMLTSRKPFDGETPSHVVVAILQEEPVPVSQLSPDIPVELEDVLSKALRKDRQARYQTAAELIEDLKNVRRQLDTQGQSTHDLNHDLKSRASPPRERSTDKPPRKMPGSSGEVKIEAKTWNAYIAKRISHHLRAIMFGTLAVVLVAGALGYFSVFQSGNAISSVAVLPFVNANSDSNIEYLSDGIADYVTNSLSRLPRLTVISSTAASRYKTRDPQTGGQDVLDVQAIGHELKVQAVVVGKVSQQGSRIQIRVELVDVRDNGHLWGEQYDRNATDILSVQEDIVKRISEKLRSSLTQKEENQLSKRYTESAQAYQSYLRGRHYWDRRTEADLQKAIGSFDEAIGIDPRYSLAYAGLADSYQLLVFHGGLSPSEYYPMSRKAAEKAIEIDDTLAEAHTSLAYEKFYYEWDWQGAEGEFKRAIELNPNYATAHQWYGEFLGHMGRADESLAERRKALRLDPLSPIITSELGFSSFEARNYDLALEEFRKATKLFPDFPPAHNFLAMACEYSGLYDEAIAECQKARTLADDSYDVVALARIYARSGKRGEAQRLLAKIVRSSKYRYYPPTLIAMVHAALGDKDKAFEWLDKAYEQRHWGLTTLKVYPMFDSLRSDPRFSDLLKRMNFPQ